MITSRVRSALLGSAVGAGLLAASTTANALEYNFGGVQVFFDTTISAGASVRVAERNNMFLPEANGGPADLRGASPTAATLPGTLGALSAGLGAQAITVFNATGAQINNFDGSINTDDGRLNFDQWDLTSGTVKMTNDIQANYENYKFFARLSSFYDAVLDRDASYERFGLGNGAKVDAARDIDLLDFYVSGDFNVGELPLNLRVGKQVISWGESTFILGGINAINPIDVTAFRRPGAEIKEGLLPVWALYGSVGLPYDLSLEAFYQLEFEEFQLDRAGTPFAGSDVGNPNLAFGGNQGIAFNSGSALAGSFRRNCTGSPNGTAAGNGIGVGSVAAQWAANIAPGLGLGALGTLISTSFPYASCADGSITDMDTRLTVGQAEVQLLANGERNLNTRLADREARDQGQYGAALRWYSEDLNSTEFGFYFMNYHSRVPIAQLETVGLPLVTLTPTNGSSGSSNALATLGCLGGNGVTATAGTIGLLPTGAFVDPALARGGTLNTTSLVSDPNGFLAALAPLADGVFTAAGTAGLAGGAVIQTSVATNGANHVDLATINCALQALQQGTGAGALPLNVNGSERLGLQQNMGIRLVYPEDIQLFGMSFNTTVGDWGVQGEVAYRRDQPLQVDTTQQIIAGASSQCTGLNLGDANAEILTFLATVPTNIVAGTTGCDLSIVTNQANNQPISFVREEVFNFDLGTTATYTNSNPLVGFLGADIGILLTEVGAIWVPDVPEPLDVNTAYGITGFPAAAGGGIDAPNAPRLASVCRTGTQLPLGSLVGLDNRIGCEPDQFSYGYVLVGQLQYNNAFGTPITLSPSVSWSHDVKGNTPSPILGGFREGSKRVSLAVSGNYQNTWSGRISYTNLMGNEQFVANSDQDFVSINLSYSF